ncbi:extracellular solute-binding protein [Acetobacter vaccinii]|uniref:Extracellular solute-binding protein n=1 Tax=Acetobacter vaccinii TaxID=2592655 RepID=A0A5C1YRE3_9PROT|nr:extracellular solute-binding protein [Acetobacter vaccinii]QEO17487.1 extracellular solute-binding protein [Acetobacter vaccinii]
MAGAECHCLSDGPENRLDWYRRSPKFQTRKRFPLLPRPFPRKTPVAPQPGAGHMGSSLLSRRSALLAGLGVLLPAAVSNAQPRHRQRHVAPARLTVLSFAGRITQTQKAVLFGPYAHMAHHPIALHPWNGSLDSLRQQEAHHPGRIAACMMETSSLHMACGIDLLAREGADTPANACGKPSASIDYAMAWDHARLDSPPNWADFWDVARHPGRRGLRNDPRTTLEVALLADGVPPDMLYRVLSSPEGVNRAFQKLDQIRPYIAWWSTPEDAGRILKSGGALMGLVPTGEILGDDPTNRQRFGLYWPQRLQVHYSWGLPLSSATNATCLSLVTWLEEPAQQQAFANAWPSLPSMQDIALTETKTGPIPPPTQLNDSFWNTALPTLAPRFQRWARLP